MYPRKVAQMNKALARNSAIARHMAQAFENPVQRSSHMNDVLAVFKIK